MIWVIGGTSDALKITQEIGNKGLNVIVSTTTYFGSSMFREKGVRVLQKILDENDMVQFIENEKIIAVIDASHPYAEVVSQNAINACRKTLVRYLRFERESELIKEARYYSGYTEAINSLKETEGNILLTIGSKNIHQFLPIGISRLTARVLPVKQSIETCEKAGLTTYQVIAMKGRSSKELNKSIMKEYDIKHMVTKDTGEPGGFYEKVGAALELGISVHVISKPKVEYPEEYSSLDEIIRIFINPSPSNPAGSRQR